MDGYYPAVQIGVFADALAALASVGIAGQRADMIAADVRERPGEPLAYSARVNGDDDQYALTLAPEKTGRIGLYVGFFRHRYESRDEALRTLAAAMLPDSLAGKFDEPPTLNAFQWIAPREALQ